MSSTGDSNRPGEPQDFLPHLAHGDMPALFLGADKESLRAQSRLKILIGFNLGLGLASAVLTSLRIDETFTPAIFSWTIDRNFTLVASAIFLSIGIILSGVVRFKKYDKIWYDGRAVAESVKTLTWKYVTRAQPYGNQLSPAQLDNAFADDLASLLPSIKNYSIHHPGPQVTPKMAEIRALPFDQRATIYLNDRVNAQSDWYSLKSLSNKRKNSWWFIALVLSQICAVVHSLVLIWHPTIHFNFVPLFTTVTASVISWTQVQKFQELAESYSVAAQELSLASERGRYLESEDALSQFVDDSETAVSREHTLWAARRK